jgi:hypothetical protein
MGRIRIPLRESLRLVVGQKRQPFMGTSLLVVFVVVCTGFLVSMPFSRTVQGAVVKKYCLSNDSFVSWAGLQLVPSMYNFGNRLWVTSEGVSGSSLDWESKEIAPPFLQNRWMNHYSLILRRMGYVRENLGNPTHVFCGSRYRQHEWVTELVVSEVPSAGLRYTYLGTIERRER